MNNIDIVAIVETLPKNASDDSTNMNFIIPGFKTITNNSGRGVCLFIRDNLDFNVHDDINNMFNPSIFTTIYSSKHEYFSLGVIYRSPNSSIDDVHKISQQMSEACKRFHGVDNKLVIVGDFNFKNIDWSSETCTIQPDVTFFNCVQENFLFQAVHEDTHFKPNCNSSLIDLILSNDYDFVTDLISSPPLGKSHHVILNFSVHIKQPPTNPNPTPKYQINKGDYSSMREHIKNINWSLKFKQDGSVDEWWDVLSNVLKESMDMFVPKKVFRQAQSCKRSFSATPDLLSKIQTKRRAFKHYKKYPSQLNYFLYSQARNMVTWETRQAVQQREKVIASKVKTDPKSFYQYVTDRTKPKENISNLTKEDGSLTNSDSEKADVLLNFFTNVFTKEDTQNMPNFDTKCDTKLPFIHIDEDKMFKALNNLKPNKSPGPDEIHPKVLKELSRELAHPMTLLFNKSLSDGVVPSAWKVAEVRPIFKKGCRSDPGNYRPVSLTSVVSKLFETFFRDALYNHLIDNNLLSNDQFGFCKGRSCVSQLLVTIKEWMSNLDKGIPTDSIYLDFSKAFDTVPHQRLLIKLEGYGISDHVLNWIRDFLTNRSQQISVNGAKSSSAPVTSGVPQGSVLGPVLFIYYINDLPSVTEGILKIFADDTKAYSTVQSDADSNKLQQCINDLTNWSEKWQLKFNSKKCKVLHIGKNNPTYSYTINDGDVTNNLSPTDFEKDLGVITDPELNFDLHIQNQVKKARQLSSLILRTISYKTIDVMLPYYKHLVRPHLEYANTVWYPHLRKHIDAIERVQRNFTKHIIELRDMNYQDRILNLGLPSLEYRRVRGDLIETYKICHKIYDPVSTNNLLNFASTNPASDSFDRRRGHPHMLTKISPNTNKYKYFFSNRVTNVWNSLPSNVATACSLNVFKNNIDQIFSHIMYATNLDIYDLPSRPSH